LLALVLDLEQLGSYCIGYCHCLAALTLDKYVHKLAKRCQLVVLVMVVVLMRLEDPNFILD
jgi:hypothetical protein